MVDIRRVTILDIRRVTMVDIRRVTMVDTRRFSSNEGSYAVGHISNVPYIHGYIKQFKHFILLILVAHAWLVLIISIYDFSLSLSGKLATGLV